MWRKGKENAAGRQEESGELVMPAESFAALGEDAKKPQTFKSNKLMNTGVPHSRREMSASR
jgi:hypothetical protein